MRVTQIKQYADLGNVSMVRIMLKDLLVAEGNSANFNKALSYAKEKVSLYEPHQNMNNVTAKNIQEYISIELSYFSCNFSEERLQNILTSYDILKMHGNVPLYHEPIDTAQMHEMKVTMIKRRIGWGSILGGITSIGAGLIASHTAATIAGVTAVVVGGTILLTNKKNLFFNKKTVFTNPANA